MLALWMADRDPGMGAPTVPEMRGSSRDPMEGRMRRQWSPDHLRLARSAVEVRETLRRLAPALPRDQARTVAQCAASLTAALKARNHGAGGDASDRR